MNKKEYLAVFQMKDGKYSYSSSNNVDDCMQFLLRCINGNTGYKKAFIGDVVNSKTIVSFREVM